jgi:hypothetical protein
VIASPGFALAARIVAALSFAAAIAAVVLPPDARVTAAAPVVSATTAAAVPPPLTVDEDVRTVIAQNIFSATRRTPAQRWSPPGLESAPPAAITTVPTTVSDVSVNMGEAPDPVPALYGTVVGEPQRRALLRLRATDLTPRLFAVGERHGGWQVVRIDSQRVVLRSAAGTRTLRLQRAGASP